MTNQMNVAPSKTKSAGKKRKFASLNKRKARAGWFFVLPFLIGFVVIYLPIIVDSFWMSFNFVDKIQNSKDFVGFDNYVYAITTDSQFIPTLTKGLTQMFIDVPMILIFSLFMAVLLNQKMAGRAIFRAILFLPVVLVTGAVEAIDMADTNKSIASAGIDRGTGSNAADFVSSLDIQNLFAFMKVGSELAGYVSSAVSNIFAIVNRSGVQILIFLAGLQSISPAIYESCKIDGATAWETFWKITFPMISPMILVNAVYTIIDAFTTKTNSIMSYIEAVSNSGVSSEYSAYSVASAMSWMYFLIVIGIIAAIAGIISGFVFYQRKD